MRKIKFMFYYFFAVVLWMMIKASKAKECVYEDYVCWKTRKGIEGSTMVTFAKLLMISEYCNVLLYRMNDSGDKGLFYFASVASQSFFELKL